MRLSKRFIILLGAVVLLGAVAAVVLTAGATHKSAAPTGFYGTSTSGASGSFASAADTTATDATLSDPAKQEPVLDQFTSHDPFKPLISQGSGSTANTAPTTGTTAQAPTSADIRINSVDYKAVKVDQQVPTNNPKFKVSALSASGVTFSLLGTNQFEDGSTSVTVAEGQTVKVTDKNSGTSYTIAVVKLNYASTSGTNTSSGSSVSAVGHSIKVLSIDSQNGTPTVTLAVDGTTYASKKVGDTFSTSWGQIRIVSIDAQGQTVTLLQGDQQYTLNVNQTLAK